jgi:glucosylceramidase
MVLAGAAAAASAESIRITAANRYQTMEGFGASLTDSSAWLINTRMTPSQRSALMTSLFSPTTGAGLSFLRQPMGASDYTTANYTFNDLPAGQTDYALTRFSIAREQAKIIPLLQTAKALNPNLRLMGTPWSPPAWMKTTGQINGGHLIDSTAVYESYANYFVKYVQAYQAQGLDINYLSVQNEPWLETNYPSMGMDPPEAARLIKLLGPKLAAAGLNTKILGFDHNWDLAKWYVPALLNDPDAAAYVHGIAYHGYAGHVSAQNEIKTQFPTKSAFFTELTGVFSNNFASDMMWDMQNLIVGGTRNHASSIVRWNLALDQNGAPYLNGPTSFCRGLVTIDSNTGAVTYNQEFYSTAHLSRFVQVGAERIESDSEKSAAFANPDGSTALVTYNDAGSPQPVVLRWNGLQARYMLPAQSAATFLWGDAASDPAVQVYLTTGDKSKLLARQADLTFATTQWVAPRMGNWFKEANWSIAVPNGIDDAAILGAGNTTPRTIYADQPLVLARLQFDSDMSYSLVGASHLTIRSSQTAAGIEVLRGHHTINLPLTIASNTSLTVAHGASLRIADPVTIAAGVVLSPSGAGHVIFDSTVTLMPSATLMLSGPASMRDLSIVESASVSLDHASRSLVQLDHLGISHGGTLDIGSSALILANTTRPTLESWITDGRLVSRSLSAAGATGHLLLLEKSAIDAATHLLDFPEVTLADGGLVALAVLMGDVDLDGTVSPADLNLITAHLHSTPSPATSWIHGDITFDGRVDETDLMIASTNLGLSIVPEPASIAIGLVGPLLCLTRRRRTTMS